MIREQVTPKGHCYIYKYYKHTYTDCIRYEVEIYREHGVTGNSIFQTRSSSDTLKGLLRIIGQWEAYFNEHL